ncbi:MAG: RNA polymerase sigma factor [Faecalicoccus sp.]|nr:RNA polymerase sigma factor [Faecalicoccus sp.]
MNKEIVEKLRHNNEEAYKEMINLTYPKLFSIALKYVKDSETARDMVQETYIDAYRKLDQLKDDEKLENWLCIIVIRKCLDYNKSSEIKHNRMTFTELIEEDNIDNILVDRSKKFQPEKNFEYNELRKAISQMISELPDTQKTAILLYYYQQFSIKEIAAFLDVSENTVKSYMRLGRQKLKTLIEKSNLPLYAAAPSALITWAMDMESQMITSIPNMSIPTGTAAGTLLSTVVQRSANTAVRTMIAASTALCVGVGSSYYRAHVQLLDHLPLVDWILPEAVEVEAQSYVVIPETEIETKREEPETIEYEIVEPATTTTQIQIANVPDEVIQEITYVDTAPTCVSADYGDTLEAGTVICD